MYSRRIQGSGGRPTLSKMALWTTSILPKIPLITCGIRQGLSKYTCHTKWLRTQIEQLKVLKIVANGFLVKSKWV